MAVRRSPFIMSWARSPQGGGGIGSFTTRSGAGVTQPQTTIVDTTIDDASKQIYMGTGSYAATSSPGTIVGYDAYTLAQTSQHSYYDNTANPLNSGVVAVRDGSELIVMTPQLTEVYKCDLAGNVTVGPVNIPQGPGSRLYNGIAKIIGGTAYFGGRYTTGSGSANWHGAFYAVNTTTLATSARYTPGTTNAMFHHRDKFGTNLIYTTETTKGLVELDLTTGTINRSVMVNFLGSNVVPAAWAHSSSDDKVLYLGNHFAGAFTMPTPFLITMDSSFNPIDDLTLQQAAAAPIPLYMLSATADNVGNWFAVGTVNNTGGFGFSSDASAIVKFSNDLSTQEMYSLDHVHFVEIKFLHSTGLLYISCNFYDTDNLTPLGMGIISVDPTNMSIINMTGPVCAGAGTQFQPFSQPTVATPAFTATTGGSLVMSSAAITVGVGSLTSVATTASTTTCAFS